MPNDPVIMKPVRGLDSQKVDLLDFPRALAVAKDVFDRAEFQHYKGHREQILQRLRKYYPAIQDRVSAAARVQADISTSRLKADSTARVLRRVTNGFGIFVFVGVITFATLLAGVWGVSEAARIRLEFLAVLLTVPVGVLTYAVMRSRRHLILRAKAEAADAENAYERELTAAVRETIATAINEELGPEGIIAFPAHAPRLVELDTSQITASQTVRYVQEFIVEHESSAIGLAGVRGSGKSTVMRAIHADQQFQPYVALVPSPVKYDPGEFLRRLLYEIATTIAGTERDNGFGGRRASDRVTRARVAFFAVIGAAGILTSTARLFDVSVDRYRIDLYLGLGLVLISAAGLLYSWLIRLTSSVDFHGPSDVRNAQAILRNLRWEVERGSTSRNTAKLWSVAETADEDSWKLKSRTLTRSDLVVELRNLLRLFADTNPGKRLVVCIDELDKLDSPDHLVEIVNELKDLFHIQGVHFVVSVSTDALESFERRGLPSRDAFDSAFDTIVETEWLTPEESLEVVSARAAGFAPPIAMFCHAWSGGLARDLLRTARAAVELQRRNADRPVTVGEIVTHIVLGDLTDATAATLRTLGPQEADLGALCELHQLLDTARRRADPQPVPHQHAAKLEFTASAHQVLQAKAVLGLRLAETAVQLGRYESYGDGRNNTTRELSTLVTTVATAMVRICGPKPLRDRAMSEALDAFDRASLGPDRQGGHGG